MTENTTPQESDLPVSKEVVGYFKDMATKFMGTSDILVECTYCHESVPAWEALCVAHLFTGGIPAHLSCPMESFLESLEGLGLETGFPYARFSENVEEKMSDGVYPAGQAVTGELEMVFLIQ